MALGKDGKIHVVVRVEFFLRKLSQFTRWGDLLGDLTPIDVVQDQERYAIDGIKLALA